MTDAATEERFPSVAYTKTQPRKGGDALVANIEISSKWPYELIFAMDPGYKTYVHGSGRIEVAFPIRDIHHLSEFIHALVCRYNALVEESNATASKAQLKQLTPIEP